MDDFVVTGPLSAKDKYTMAPVSIKAFLRLNRLCTQALSKHIQGSPEQVNVVLLQTKAALTDVLKRLSVQTNVQLFLDIQGIICEMMLNGVTENNVNEFLLANKRVSEALENQFKWGDVKDLIKVNMELSHVLILGTQDKLMSLLAVISEGLASWEVNEEVKPFFHLNDAISQTLTLKFEGGRLDFISELNRFLAEIMSRDYPNGSFFRLVQLSHITCLAIIDKCKNSEHLYMANLQLSELMRSTPDVAFHEDLLNLNSDLARLFVQTNTNIKFCRLIGWKLQLSNVMQKVSKSMGETEEAEVEDNEETETPREVEETSDGEERVSSLPDVLKKTISEEVVTIPELGGDANELQCKSSTSRQQYRNVQLGDTKDNGEPRAEVPVTGERSTAAVVAEVPEGQPSVEGEKQGVAEGSSRLMQIPGDFSRSKKDFMTTMLMPPVTLGQKRAENIKNARPLQSEDDTNEA